MQQFLNYLLDPRKTSFEYLLRVWPVQFLGLGACLLVGVLTNLYGYNPQPIIRLADRMSLPLLVGGELLTGVGIALAEAALIWAAVWLIKKLGVRGIPVTALIVGLGFGAWYGVSLGPASGVGEVWSLFILSTAFQVNRQKSLSNAFRTTTLMQTLTQWILTAAFAAPVLMRR